MLPRRSLVVVNSFPSRQLGLVSRCSRRSQHIGVRHRAPSLHQRRRYTASDGVPSKDRPVTSSSGGGGTPSSTSWKRNESASTAPAESSSSTSSALPAFTQREFEGAFWEWFAKDKNWMIAGAPIPKFTILASLFYGAMAYATISSLSDDAGEDETALETSVASAAVVSAELENRPLMCLISAAGAMGLSAAFASWWVPRRTEKSMNIYSHTYCKRVPKADVLGIARNSIRATARRRGIVGAMGLTLGLSFATVGLPYVFFRDYVREMNRIGWDNEPSAIPSAGKCTAFTLSYTMVCISAYVLTLGYSPFLVVPAMTNAIAAFPLLSTASSNIVKVTTRLARNQAMRLHQELAMEDDLLGLSDYQLGRPQQREDASS